MAAKGCLVSMVVSLMLLLQGIHGGHACLEAERLALLQIKHSFNISSQPGSWGEDADCCDWAGVGCNSTTGRVVELDLRYIRYPSREYYYLGDWYLNASCFLPFQQLKTLTLDGNGMAGWVENEGFERLSVLDSLEFLSLSGNKFNNTVLSSLSGLSSLKSLYLNDNKLKGLIDINELKHLELLDLGENEIEGFRDFRGFGNVSFLLLRNMTTNGRRIPFSLLQSLAGFPNLKSIDLRMNNFEGTMLVQALLPLKNLEELNLSGSTLDNSFLKAIGRITTLQILQSDNSKLSGTIPTTQGGLCDLKHLRSLDLRNNDLNGNLPWCLANLTSLKELQLSFNHLTGYISSSPLISLTSIQYLYLSDNHFQIPISLSPFFNHSELKTFNGLNNEIYVESEDHNLTPKFQLEELYLSGNGKRGVFPKFLFHQNNLQEMEFFNWKLRGGFPNWLLENSTNLNVLILANNSLSGPFQLPIHPHLSLYTLDISDNYFHDRIPFEIGAYFPNLGFLSMSQNNFGGSIPSSLRDMPYLVILDLSENNISGTIPSGFFSTPLNHFYLSHNSVQGHLGDSFYNSSELLSLDLSHNRLTGSIPEWIGEISHLYFLLLGHNNLEGEIPIQLCKLGKLNFIDLSFNNFSGHIPPYLISLTDPYSIIQGPLEITAKGISYLYSMTVLRYMSGIDLSFNNLTGEIPPEIGNLNNVRLLNLSNNHLTGHIPQTLSNLSQVESLDLSNNNLNVKIPPHLVELHSLSFFSVAHNNFSGKTPKMVGQFSTFNERSYEDNPFLCGPPISRSCPDEKAPSSSPKTSTSDKDESGLVDTTVFYVSFVVTYVMVLFGIVAVLYINPVWRRAWFFFIKGIINNCYYFFVDNLLAPLGFRGRAWKPLV